jgi:cobalt-zinc-cadmium efflux system membrane fusion protein
MKWRMKSRLKWRVTSGTTSSPKASWRLQAAGTTRLSWFGTALCGIAVLLAGCEKKTHDPAAEAPPAASPVVQVGDPSLVRVEHPEHFPLVSAVAYQATSTLNVTGSVTPDVSREIPVVALANGRVVAVHVRLGDFVHKGQLIMEIQSTDVANAFNQYLKAVNDERLARTVLDRDQLLYSKGAIAKSQVEIAQDAEDDALADLRAAEQQLHVLGVDPKHPGETVKVLSPASGFIIQQNVTEASTAGVGLSGSSNAFVIADLSHVWILCDVYENDLATVHVGQSADIHLSAYPDRLLTGTIGDVGALLDPNLRTGKVRVQVPNPGYLMRVGMFATATFHGKKLEMHAAVPSTAILHLHDRDWVYVPTGNGGADANSPQFRRVSVVGGAMLPDGAQEVNSGLAAGQQVVRNALELQNTAAQ